MAVEKKASRRDETLIRVLDRLSDSITSHELQLEEIKKQQGELMREAERILARQFARCDITDKAIEKSHEALNRYRSDMLSLVGEQDRLNEIAKELSKKQSAIAFSQDNLVNTLNDVSKRLEAQEKAVRSLSEHFAKREEALGRELAEARTSITKLHLDAEKRAGETQRATQRRLDDIRQEAQSQAQAAAEIGASLEVLLTRTAPREKKPFFVVRVYRKLRRYKI